MGHIKDYRKDCRKDYKKGYIKWWREECRRKSIGGQRCTG